MRYSVVVAGLFAAAASAQSETAVSSIVSAVESSVSSAVSSIQSSVDSITSGASVSTPSAPSGTVSIDPAQTSAQAAILACINACDDSDVDCKAQCITVPSPNNHDANQTNQCVAECPQGNGTAADNQAFANCVSGCIAEYFYSTTGTPNTQTSGSASGSATPTVTQVESTVTSDGSTFVTSFSTTIPPSGTGTGSGDNAAETTSSSSAGADMLFSPVGSGIGLFSFLAAFLAL